jgi:hypothetical protein
MRSRDRVKRARAQFPSLRDYRITSSSHKSVRLPQTLSINQALSTTTVVSPRRCKQPPCERLLTLLLRMGACLGGNF